MKRLCLCLFLCISTTAVFAAEKMRIAVIDLKPRGISKVTAVSVSDLIRSDIVDSGLFTVVERAQMRAVLKEQSLQMAGCTDNDCAVQMGKLLSARKILVGELSRIGRTVLITVRIVDVEKGVSEFSAREKAKSINELDTAAEKLIKRLINSIGGTRVSHLAGYIEEPENVEATDGDYSDRIKITWKGVKRAEQYYVFRREKNGKYYLAGKTTKTEFTDKNIKSGKTYKYKVKSSIMNRFSDFSASASGMMGKSHLGYYLRGIVPGWAQMYYGNTLKGSIIMGSFGSLGAVWGYSFYSYMDKKDAYDSLPSMQPQEQYDKAYRDYNRAGKFTMSAGIVLAAIYLYNWIDIIWFNDPVFLDVSTETDETAVVPCFRIYNTATLDAGNETQTFAGVTLKF